MSDLARMRRAIRPLLDQRAAVDAMAAYYAFHHPDDRTRLFAFPETSNQTRGYIALSRTGIDLFRPLLTLRLPPGDLEGSADLVYSALSPNASVFIHAPVEYRPLLSAFFALQGERTLHLYALDRNRFTPEINVLVVRATTPDGLPRFIVRPQGADSEAEVGASATLNWKSPRFADVSVYTNPQYRQRGWGRSVVSALVRHLLQQGRTPLYEVEQRNEASIHLAEAVGFVNTGAERILVEGTLRPRPG